MNGSGGEVVKELGSGDSEGEWQWQASAGGRDGRWGAVR